MHRRSIHLRRFGDDGGEGLIADVVAVSAMGHQVRLQRLTEVVRAADVHVRLEPGQVDTPAVQVDVERLQPFQHHLGGDAAGRPGDVRPAVDIADVHVGVFGGHRLDLGAERHVAGRPRPVDQEHGRGVRPGQLGLEHGEEWGDADAYSHQRHRPKAAHVDGEGAARRLQLHPGARARVVQPVGAGAALAAYGQPVVRRLVGEGR